MSLRNARGYEGRKLRDQLYYEITNKTTKETRKKEQSSERSKEKISRYRG